MRILSRYLLKAAAGPFLFALGVLTGLLMINTVARRIEDLAGKGLPPSVIAEVFLLSIPHVLALTLPMAVLVAVLYAFSQLAADNEITALKASGINLARLVVPLLGAATVIAGLMLWFNDQLLPDTNHRLKNLLIDVSRKSPTLQLSERVINPIPSSDHRTRYYMQAAEIDPATNALSEVVIWDMSDPRQMRTVYADSGQMAFNRQQTDLFLTLYNGHINQLEEGLPERFQRVFFDEQVLRMRDVGNVLERSQSESHRSDREMGLAMLSAEAERRRGELSQIRDETRRLSEAALERVLAGATGPLYARDLVADSARTWTDSTAADARRRRLEREAEAEAARSEMDEEAAGAAGREGQRDRDGVPVPVTRREVEAARDVEPGRETTPAPGVEPGRETTPAQELEPGGEGEAGQALAAGMRRRGAALPLADSARRDSLARTREARAPAVERPLRTRSGRRASGDLLTASVSGELSSLAARARAQSLQISSFEVEYQKKLAIPFACIVFVLIGAPLAVRFPRGGVGMVIAISLGIFAVYYVGLIGGEKLADKGHLDPFWAMWGINALFLFLGVWGMARIGHEASTSRGGGWDDLLYSIRSLLARPFRARAAASADVSSAGAEGSA